jgi:hypothetical protein
LPLQPSPSNLPLRLPSLPVIVSYETTQLEAFSLCILQQNNVFGCDAAILSTPAVPLLRSWRGAPLDTAAARQIFIGHFDCEEAHPSAAARLPWSWKIVCGANPAYDAFPAQHQIFYPSDKSPNTLWYTVPARPPAALPPPPLTSQLRAISSAISSVVSPPLTHLAPVSHLLSPHRRYDPVFKVETLDGRQVWCKRHYRCVPRTVLAPELAQADGSSAGAWTLSTLDNGVISKEHWTTVDAAGAPRPPRPPRCGMRARV